MELDILKSTLLNNASVPKEVKNFLENIKISKVEAFPGS